MILFHLLTFLLLSILFITLGRYLFWALFIKDAPSMEEQDAHLYRYSRE